MFNGNSTVSINTTKSKEEVIVIVEEQLEDIGATTISDTGGITIQSSRYNGTGFESTIYGRLNERDGRFIVSIDYEVKLVTLGWVIVVCFFPIGLALLLLPNNTKGDIERKLERSLSEIKAILNERK
jgi:hypothetical protein